MKNFKMKRPVLLLMKKILYLLSINLLQINLVSQILIIILGLSAFLYLSITKNAYKLDILSDYDINSQGIVIFTFFLKLLTLSLNLAYFNLFSNSLILLINFLFIGLIITQILMLFLEKIKIIFRKQMRGKIISYCFLFNKL